MEEVLQARRRLKARLAWGEDSGRWFAEVEDGADLADITEMESKLDSFGLVYRDVTENGLALPLIFADDNGGVEVFALEQR